MRRRKLLVPILLVLVLLLTSCGGKTDGTMQSALDFRANLMKQQSCSFTLDITADFGVKVYNFAGQCQYEMEQGGEITLTAPENLAGISAAVRPDGAKVEFEDVQLELGQMAEGHVSPMQLPLLLGQCWTQEYISAAAKADDGRIQVTYSKGYGEEQLLVYTWLEEKTLAPVYCEVFYQDERVLRADISEFTV